MNTKVQAVKEMAQWIDAQKAPATKRLLMLHYLELLSEISWYEFVFTPERGREGSTD